MGCLNIQDTRPVWLGYNQVNQSGKSRRLAQISLKKSDHQIKKPKFFNGPDLPDQIQQKLFNFTKANDFAMFQQLLQQNEEYYNSQASTKGTFWTIPMICARWDAIDCLRIYLYHLYRLHGQQEYLQMHTVIQIQSYDIIMLAAVFNSRKCLQLLFQYGGSLLNIKDKLGRSTAQILKGTKNQDLAEKVKELLSKNNKIIPLNRKAITCMPVGNLTDQKIDRYVNQIGKDLQSNEQIEKVRAQQKQRLIQGYQKVRLLAQKRVKDNLRRLDKENKIKKQLNYNIKQYPQYIRPTIIQCFQNGKKFQDHQFPPSSKSISNNSNADPIILKAQFRRVQDLFKEQIVLFDQIHPYDIVQGCLGICYYLSTISSIAQHPQNIRRLFKTQQISPIGAYVLNFYIHGKLTDIVIDDFIPVFNSTMNPIFSRPVGNQIWALLLQKAWVKNFGSYTEAQGMAPQEMLSDLTGTPSQGYWINKMKDDQIFDMAYQFNKKNYILILSSIQGLKNIIAGHAYSLLQVYNIGGVKLYKIRNPWGSFQYQGQYGDNSKSWTPQLQKAVNLQKKDDGVFYMTPSQLLQGFSYLSVGFIDSSFKRTQFQFKSQFKQEKFFKFTLNSKQAVSITLCQRNARYIKNSQYKYSSCQFQVVGKGAFFDGDSQGVFFGAKYIHFCQKVIQTLQAGDYLIRIKMNWTSKVNEAVIVTNSAQELKISSCQNPIGKNIWQQNITQFMQKQINPDQLNKGLVMYNKFYKPYLAYLLVNNGISKLDIQISYKQQHLINLKYGYNMEGTVMKCQLQSGQKKFYLFDRLKMNTQTAIGGFGYIVQQVS